MFNAYGLALSLRFILHRFELRFSASISEFWMQVLGFRVSDIDQLLSLIQTTSSHTKDALTVSQQWQCRKHI